MYKKKKIKKITVGNYTNLVYIVNFLLIQKKKLKIFINFFPIYMKHLLNVILNN